MNRNAVLLITAGLLVLISTACQKDNAANKANGNATPTAASTPDEFVAARASFDKNCKTCHTNGEGGPVKLDDGTKLKVPSLRAGHALRHSDAEVFKQITKGGDGMPAFGEKLKTEEINDLVRFIRHEFQAGRTPTAK
jgi:mono/diheme cytochrome c family protein